MAEASGGGPGPRDGKRKQKQSEAIMEADLAQGKAKQRAIVRTRSSGAVDDLMSRRRRVCERPMPKSAPMASDALKSKTKMKDARPIRRSSGCSEACLKERSVLVSTMATASLRTDSPKTRAKTSSCTPIAWKTLSTDTGSVAEIRLPKVSEASIPIG